MQELYPLCSVTHHHSPRSLQGSSLVHRDGSGQFVILLLSTSTAGIPAGTTQHTERAVTPVCYTAHGGSLAGVTGGHAAALDAHGGLWLWGGNGSGQLGLGLKHEFVDTPMQPPYLCARLRSGVRLLSAVCGSALGSDVRHRQIHATAVQQQPAGPGHGTLDTVDSLVQPRQVTWAQRGQPGLRSGA